MKTFFFFVLNSFKMLRETYSILMLGPQVVFLNAKVSFLTQISVQKCKLNYVLYYEMGGNAFPFSRFCASLLGWGERRSLGANM